MFPSPLRKFSHIRCPNADNCKLPKCIFSHEPKAKATSATTASTAAALSSRIDINLTEGPERKRRKVEIGTAVSSSADETAATVTKPKQQAFYGALKTERKSQPAQSVTNKKKEDGIPHLKTATKAVSPPLKPSETKAQPNGKAPPGRKEVLNPRKVLKDPAGHQTRLMLLTKLHEGMARLNQEVAKSDDPAIKALHLSADELIVAALDEEERFVKEYTNVYSNMIKQRILAYSKKMKLDEWVKSRQELTKGPEQKAVKKVQEPKPLDTGLSPEEELLVLPRLVAYQPGLEAHGYVTKPPTAEEIEQARQGVEASANYEQCDRCTARFQVFPNRREEDGALTTGGMCTYHPQRRYFPKKEKTDMQTGPKTPRYACCHQEVGSPGCTHEPTHVFKISEPKRLALVMPFIGTPSNPDVDKSQAVCFDCEMGYTCYGLELIRLTAVSWPSGKPLIDILVKPLGHVLDLNTRFSGVQPDQFSTAEQFDYYSEENPYSENGEPLKIVPSPAAARQLLLRYLSPETFLLGHALENDLNAVRLVHPNIVDTILLFPHPRGLPMRFGLRQLTQQYLGKAIQTAGAAGHDSLEDARATGDLVRYKVGKEWQHLQEFGGWSIKDGKFYYLNQEEPSELPKLFGPKKRKRDEVGGLLDGADESAGE